MAGVRGHAAGRDNSQKGTYVPQTLQAAELVLAAIARSDGTRASVLRELQGLQGRDGMLGPFRFDRNGDVTPEHVTIFRVTGHTPRSANLVSDFEGSVPVLDRLGPHEPHRLSWTQ